MYETSEMRKESIPVIDDILADFALKVEGEGLANEHIHAGDIVYFLKQDDVESNELAAVMVNGKALLKRVGKEGDHIFLMDGMGCDMVHLPNDDFMIMGKAVAVLSRIQQGDK